MQESKGFWSWRCRVVPPGMGSSFGHSAFIHFFWKNKVLLTFYLDRFFLLPPLHLSSLSSYDTSPDVSLDIFFFLRLQAEIQTAAILSWAFLMIDWTCLQIPLLVSLHSSVLRLRDWVKEESVKDVSTCPMDWAVSSSSAEPSLMRAPATPQRMGDRSAISFKDYLLKGWFSDFWERHPWVVKTGKDWEKIYISTSQKENWQLQVF